MNKKALRAQRARSIYEYVREYMAEHGWAPTYREIGDAIDAAPSQVRLALRLLEEAELVELGERCEPRAIRITGSKTTFPRVAVVRAIEEALV